MFNKLGRNTFQNYSEYFSFSTSPSENKPKYKLCIIYFSIIIHILHGQKLILSCVWKYRVVFDHLNFGKTFSNTCVTPDRLRTVYFHSTIWRDFLSLTIRGAMDALYDIPCIVIRLRYRTAKQSF